VLYDVTTLHFENEDEDALRKVGISKEHRVDPQVQVGLLVDPGGFPLEVHVFEGNKAETTTLIPVLEAFQNRHGVTPRGHGHGRRRLRRDALGGKPQRARGCRVLLHRRVPANQGPL
jgi:hypothetical protein